MTTPPIHLIGSISLPPMSFPINLGCHETHNFNFDKITQWINTGGVNGNGKLNCPACRREIQADQISYNSGIAKEVHRLARSQADIFEADNLSDIKRDEALT
ncbi:MAG: hypothetical protein ACI9S8_002153 [Chlamydiales bacterium]|jgi:hypothetical protein